MPTNKPSDFASGSVSDAMRTAEPAATQQPLSFGQKLVGLTFNPSNDSGVDTAKRICAQLADMVRAEYNNGNEVTPLKTQLYNHTIGEILNCQMNVVKILTLKY